MFFRIGIFLIVISQINGCNSPTPAPTAPPPTPTAAEAPSMETRLQAETDYETLRQLHQNLSAIWEGLQRGENIQCGGQFSSPSPETILGDDAIHTHLRQAARDLTSAANLWRAECQDSRPTVPPETIQRGVLLVRGAGDALGAAEKILMQQ